MFGYVRALASELKVKEYELYKSVYCGLCHHIKKRGHFMTFSLSYDFVLPSLFAVAFSEKDELTFKKKRCLAHPFKKRKVLDGGEKMQAVADSAILLVYYKLLDDKNDRDSGFLKKTASAFALPFAARARKKVMKIRGEKIDLTVKEKMRALSVVEENKRESVYEGADIFGELLAEVFSADIKSDSDRRCMHEIGFHVGRWIYVTDALDDMEKDRKSGSYNPLVLSGGDLNDEKFKENIEISLRLELTGCETALDLIQINDSGIKNIIENTLYLGMPEVVKSVLAKKDEKRNKPRKSPKGNKSAK